MSGEAVPDRAAPSGPPPSEIVLAVNEIVGRLQRLDDTLRRDDGYTYVYVPVWALAAVVGTLRATPADPGASPPDAEDWYDRGWHVGFEAGSRAARSPAPAGDAPTIRQGVLDRTAAYLAKNAEPEMATVPTFDLWVLYHAVVAAGDAPREDAPGLRDVFAVNLARCVSQDGFNHPLDSWSIAEWTNAIAGEAGEACNIAKKLIRFRDQVRGNTKPGDTNEVDLRHRLALELADVVIYCDLTARALGVDLEAVTVEAFNRKSEQLGMPYLASALRGAVSPSPGTRAASEGEA
jgi:NTP pyrophosphatase (non-canonical NTP hydrolase)